MKNLKRIIGIFSVLSFGFVCLNICFSATGIVNTPAARVREKASIDSTVITKVYENDEVEILAEEGDWYQVKVNGKTGYISKTLIKTSETKNSSTKTSNTNNGVSTYTTEEPEKTDFNYIISKDTTLKLLPNFASNDLRILTKDTKVKVVKELNNWTKISITDNSTGWILKNNISNKKVEEANIVENTETTNTEIDNTAKNNIDTTNAEVNNTTKNDIDTTNTEVNNTTTNNVDTTNTAGKTTITENLTSSVKDAKGKVNVETANVREKANKSSKIIERLDEGNEVTIVEEEGDWYKITTSKVPSGYVLKSLITVISDEVSSRSQVEPREEENQTSNNLTTGLSVVEFAKQYLGFSYVLGGKNPETGFDCSGFTGYVFKHFGYTLGSIAADQDSVGKKIERTELQPGDLILFQNEGKTKIGHTGIYIGNNEFIHAANPDRGVVIDNLQTMSYYNERFVTARRIVE